jgi:hypothetical protein
MEFLSVYCKLPNGLTMCLEDGNDIKKVTLPRSSRYILPHPKFIPTKEEYIVFSSTVTPVAKDFWDAWVKKVGPDYPPLKNRMVWAVPAAKKADGIAAAREMETAQTGFEQIDPKKTGIKGISKRDERDAPDKDDEEV